MGNASGCRKEKKTVQQERLQWTGPRLRPSSMFFLRALAREPRSAAPRQETAGARSILLQSRWCEGKSYATLAGWRQALQRRFSVVAVAACRPIAVTLDPGSYLIEDSKRFKDLSRGAAAEGALLTSALTSAPPALTGSRRVTHRRRRVRSIVRELSLIGTRFRVSRRATAVQGSRPCPAPSCTTSPPPVPTAAQSSACAPFSPVQTCGIRGSAA